MGPRGTPDGNIIGFQIVRNFQPGISEKVDYEACQIVKTFVIYEDAIPIVVGRRKRRQRPIRIGLSSSGEQRLGFSDASA